MTWRSPNGWTCRSGRCAPRSGASVGPWGRPTGRPCSCWRCGRVSSSDRASGKTRRVWEEIADVAVVGAGPAGSASALRVLQLRPDARVLLLDAAAFPRDKTCGDGVAAHVFDLLDALGVPDLRPLGPAVPGLRLRSPGGQVVARRCARPNHPIPRAVFDARLVDAAVAAGRDPASPPRAGPAGRARPGGARRTVRRPGGDRRRRGELRRAPADRGPADAAACRGRRDQGLRARHRAARTSW